ncbi:MULTISPECIES: hypothetical protein [Acinetobacter]|uniref:Lipoprotein n=2 Tax=Acinetobacter haemolyticus TaxID=29430 RepID=A0A1L6KM19_ACIHA|nr:MULTISPECIES: hypothetical protein [Acinetobacter]APR70127.1 hypothetical protein AHTJS_06885 [Acinetobacter haemolyticus]ATZ67487.1 hypothetical protein BSR56_09020 [Acinetobacter haemolyticus]EEH68582.1 hypothetical protein HMPREF0023_1879 [Acinetobacter sp. ATCC 27244]ENW17394.1 hypothetical protein F927_02336 [Acinetobacter haemolyticus CIP 64.3 = MTCC 9819]ENW20920.1 hypothetical protein F926_01695 [Acinetobacter haemolyticus NIPH 261]
MNLKLTLIALMVAPTVMLTACAKKEEAKNAEQAAEVESVQTSPEQQAAIDAIDKPILDEKNTDVEDAEVAASEAQ